MHASTAHDRPPWVVLKANHCTAASNDRQTANQCDLGAEQSATRYTAKSQYATNLQWSSGLHCVAVCPQSVSPLECSWSRSARRCLLVALWNIPVVSA